MFHRQYHHLFHYPLIDSPPPPIGDDIVTGASRTLPPPQIWHSGDPHKSGIPVTFLWWRENTSLKRGKKKSVVYWSLLYWTLLLRMTYGSQNGVSIRWSHPRGDQDGILCCAWQPQKILSPSENEIIVCQLVHKDFSLNINWRAITNAMEFNFWSNLHTLDAFHIVADGRAADYLACARSS